MQTPRLLALAALLSVPLAHAGYAQLTPPPGWSPGTGAGAVYQAAANESWVNARLVSQSSVNIGNRLVNVPTAYRFAANAPRIAAQFAFRNPYVAIASVAVTAWLATGGLSYDTVARQWIKPAPAEPTQCSPGSPNCVREYRSPAYTYLNNPAVIPGQPPWNASFQRACEGAGVYLVAASHEQYPTISFEYTGSTTTNGECRVQYKQNGYSRDDAAPLLTRDVLQASANPLPVLEPEFTEIMAPKPLPNLSPSDLPTPLPVEQPLLNPVPAPDGNPSPFFVPTGDPVPVPNTNPQQYTRPGVDVVPSPTPDQPYRVDLQPTTRTQSSPDPNAVPSPTTSTSNPPQTITCGLPGTPPCKIDESGTPTSKDLPVDDAPIKADQQVRRDAISGTADKPTFSAYQALFSAPPVAACSPFAFPGGQSVDPCPFVDTARAAVGVAWALVSFWLCLGWVREAI